MAKLGGSAGLLALCVVCAGIAGAQPAAVAVPQPEPDAAVDPFNETQEQRDARMAWWREARFGMFIHWGLYAIPAGQWGESTNHAEWIRTTAQIPLEEYDGFVGQFNPVNFDARAWARMAREAGMKYIVITTKHHDGFALWDSAVSDFDVMATPFKRDIIRELADAARAEGLQIGFYHSIMDWHHPDYLPRRDWETSRSAEGADFERFEEYLHAQVTELLTNYGPVGVMWFDGEWEDTWTEERGRELYALCRRLQPGIIVNNRVGKGREGMAGLTRDGAFGGDFGTPEQEVPATGFPPEMGVVDWESCMTMNDHWGYNAFDHNWKSTTELIRTLVDIASKGGNYLLNVGPRADGTFPPEAVDRLREIGEWMEGNGHAIHGTTASPFGRLPWGRCTVGRDPEIPEVSTLYLHVFDWPSTHRLEVPGLANTRMFARYPALRNRPPSGEMNPDVERQGASAVITNLRLTHLDPRCTVLALHIMGEPDIYASPIIRARADEFIEPLTVTLSHPRSTEDSPLDLRYTLDGTDPVATSPAYDGPLVFSNTATVRVQAWRGDTPVSPVAERTFTRVTPARPMAVPNPRHGFLRREQYQGTWDQMPEFVSMTPVKTDEAAGLTLEGRIADERFAAQYTGFLYIRSTGVYRFSLSSDDGSRLWLAGRLVVDNDGLHADQAREGTIALEAGYHPIRVEYFNRTGQRALSLRGEIMGRPMVELQPRSFALDGPPPAAAGQ